MAPTKTGAQTKILRCELLRYPATVTNDKANVGLIACDPPLKPEPTCHSMYKQSTHSVGDLVPSVQHIIVIHPFIWAVYRQHTAASITPEN